MNLDETYTPDNAERITRRFNESGWNLYDATDIDEPAPAQVVPQGPATTARRGAHYIVFPQTDDPEDVDQMNAALTPLASNGRLESVMNIDLPDGTRRGIVGIELRETGAIFHPLQTDDPEKEIVRYADLPHTLDRLPPSYTVAAELRDEQNV